MEKNSYQSITPEGVFGPLQGTSRGFLREVEKKTGKNPKLQTFIPP